MLRSYDTTTVTVPPWVLVKDKDWEEFTVTSHAFPTDRTTPVQVTATLRGVAKSVDVRVVSQPPPLIRSPGLVVFDRFPVRCSVCGFPQIAPGQSGGGGLPSGRRPQWVRLPGDSV